MTDDEIKLILMDHATKEFPPKDLDLLMQKLCGPLLDFFHKEKNLAKSYIVAQRLEDLLIHVIKSEILKSFRNMNTDREDLH